MVPWSPAAAAVAFSCRGTGRAGHTGAGNLCRGWCQTDFLYPARLVVPAGKSVVFLLGAVLDERHDESPVPVRGHRCSTGDGRRAAGFRPLQWRPHGRATTWSKILTAFQPVARDHQDVLPLAPCWRVDRAHVLDSSPAALTSELADLAGEQAHYWVLQQGPLAPGSRRESLLNLDTDMARAAALGQTFRRDDSPDNLIFQCMPPQRAAGVLFSRHPMRPDLDHIVIEGCLQGSDQQQRVILHADGALAWRSDGADAFLDELGTAAFHQLAQSLHDSYGEPRAAEWIWDGQRLWLVQALPIGTLPMPSEVWTRRAGLGFAAQAISPLWYTMMARWLKEGFWRVIGQRAGWRELGNIEP